MKEEKPESKPTTESTFDEVTQRSQKILHDHIFCLPTEILTDAFSYLLPESLAIHDVLDAFEMDSDWDLHSERKHDDIIHISHVCRSWRQICLSTPSFWSPVWVTDEDRFAPRTEEFVSRSDTIGLEIAVRDECSRIQRLGRPSKETDKIKPFNGPLVHPLLNLFELFPHVLQQVKSLRISSRFHPGQDFTSCFNKAAPLLESFALKVDTYNTSDFETSPFRLPLPLFRNSTPSLKKLSLEDAEIPWTDTIFRNLTFLRIFKDMDRRESNHVKLDELLQILEDCPALVSLELGFSGPTVSTDHANSRGIITKVCVPSLRNINLSGMKELTPVNSFLSCLQQTSQLQTLAVGHFNVSVLSIDDFLPQTLTFDSRSNLCNCINMDSDVKCNFMTVDQFTVDHLESKMTCNPRYFSLRWLRETDSSFQRRIRCINDDDRIFETRGEDPDEFRTLSMTFLRRMCSSPKMIRAISFRGSDSALDELAFEDIFRYLPNIYCVEVRNNLGFVEAESFMEFLESEAGEADKGDTEVALRSVYMLIFDSVDFRASNFYPLRRFLKHRKKRKAPILYVGLNYCRGVDRKRMSALEKLVPSVCVVDDALCEKYGEEMDIPWSGYMVDEY